MEEIKEAETNMNSELSTPLTYSGEDQKGKIDLQGLFQILINYIKR